MIEIALGDAEIVEFAHGIGLQIDADAERAQCAHRFERDPSVNGTPTRFPLCPGRRT